jgi:hypothetical protein
LTTKWAIFGTVLAVGVVAIGVGAFLLIKSRMMAKEAGANLGVINASDDKDDALLNNKKPAPIIRINLSEKGVERETDIEDADY